MDSQLSIRHLCLNVEQSLCRDLGLANGNLAIEHESRARWHVSFLDFEDNVIKSPMIADRAFNEHWQVLCSFFELG